MITQNEQITINGVDHPRDMKLGGVEILYSLSVVRGGATRKVYNTIAMEQ